MARAQQAALSRGNRGMLVLAVLAGLAAAVLVFVAIARSGGGDSGSVSGPVTVKAVVAARNIPAGKEITADMLKVVDVPESLLVKGAYSDSKVIVGEIANTRIATGEQVTPGKIGALVEDKGLAPVVPAGKRGIAMSIHEVTAVGGLLLPGDKVDIVAAIREKVSPDADLEFMRVVTFLSDVEVLSVAQEAQEPPAKPKEGEEDSSGDQTTTDSPTSGRVPEDPENQPSAGTVTVALDPSQVQTLVAMQETAESVWLSLRPFGEEGSTNVEPIVVPIVR